MESTKKISIKGNIPNLITLFNLISGCIGIYLAIIGKLEAAVYLLFAGAFFDLADGMLARLLKVTSDIGKQLDSLSDLVTFGLLPTAMIFAIQKQHINLPYDQYQWHHWLIVLSTVLIPVFSAIRLAKFNIDKRQASSFLGLPTPANALFITGITWAQISTGTLISTLTESTLTISILTTILCILMVTEIPLFSLKFSSLKWKENSTRYIFLIGSLFLLAIFGIPGISVVIIWYIVLSMIVG